MRNVGRLLPQFFPNGVGMNGGGRYLVFGLRKREMGVIGTYNVAPPTRRLWGLVDEAK